MDELGFNKIAAAVLATALGFMGLKEISHYAIHTSELDAPVYALEIPEETGAVEVVELPFPQPVWVNAMDAERGAKVFAKCTSCHNAENGGANGTGPNLWNVVGAPAGQHAGFNYSSAMTNSGKVWSYASLDEYLEKPTRYIQGTNMNFVGLKKEEDRAAVIEYLRVAADTPIARPDPIIVEAEPQTPEGDTLEASVDGPIDDAAAAIENAGDAIVDTASDAVDGAEGVVNDIIEGGEAPVSDGTDAAANPADVEATTDAVETEVPDDE